MMNEVDCIQENLEMEGEAKIIKGLSIQGSGEGKFRCFNAALCTSLSKT